MKNFNTVMVVCLMSLLVLSCDVNSPLSLAFSPPKCKLKVVDKSFVKSGGSLQITMEATNYSEPIAYNVGCLIKIKMGSTIIERSSLFFSTLEPGESAIEDTWFSKIKSKKDYDRIEILLYWYDAESEYYEKHY